MFELLFLLLPLAMAYGWYMGHRSAKKDQENLSNQLSRDYVAGMNLLLSNQHEKAVDLFLNILQKQETENDIHNDSQFEAELTLGNLFRSRGEIDRALRIHQSLENNPNLSFEQRLLTRQQLAKDFMSIGFFDRAESLYISLVDEPDFAENALKELANIYQRTKEWKKAANVAEKYLKLKPRSEYPALSHYYCELALLAQQENDKTDIILNLLKKALAVSPSCVRASLMLADEYAKQKKYQLAIDTLQSIAEQDVRYIGEVLPQLWLLYQKTYNLQDYELFLIKVAQKRKNSAVEIALAEYLDKKLDKNTASQYLYHQLEQKPTIPVFRRFLQYQIDNATQEQEKNRLLLLHKLIDDKINLKFAYRCVKCGFQSHKLIWQCPSCHKWESVKPNLEHDN